MRILIPTIGSRGDVQPYINLGQGLRKAGHQVIAVRLIEKLKITDRRITHVQK